MQHVINVDHAEPRRKAHPDALRVATSHFRVCGLQAQPGRRIVRPHRVQRAPQPPCRNFGDAARVACTWPGHPGQEPLQLADLIGEDKPPFQAGRRDQNRDTPARFRMLRAAFSCTPAVNRHRGLRHWKVTRWRSCRRSQREQSTLVYAGGTRISRIP